MTDQHERIARAIREWDGQGWHRTGTETDRVSAEWLAERVRDCGLEPTLEPFALRRVAPQLSYLEIEGRRLEGLPLFDGAFTTADGLHGRIGPLGTDSEIGLAEVGPAGQAEAFEEGRRSRGHRALVAVTVGDRPGLAPRNAWSFTSPFGPPVLQVSSEAQAWLGRHAERRSGTHVVVRAGRTHAQAFNVIATLPGQGRGLPPLVVMTPRSGWWHCAGERGGGLACWLEVMRAVRQNGSTCDVVFLASSGHELGHLGLEAFLERRPGLAVRALAWLRFGASIGAAQEPRSVLFASDDALERSAVRAMAREGAGPVPAASRTTRPSGEALNIHDRGGRYVSLVGGNALFHLEADRWPAAVDVASVARYANAFAHLAAGLTQDAPRAS